MVLERPVRVSRVTAGLTVSASQINQGIPISGSRFRGSGLVPDFRADGFDISRVSVLH